MLRKSLPASRTKVGAVAAAGLISVSALCLAAPAARRWLSRSPAPAAASPRLGQTGYRNSAIVLTLRPTGFEPPEVTLPQGRYLLAVENRTGLAEEVDLRLQRENGNGLREKRLGRGRPVWKEVVDLPPGRYAVTEAGHPEWVCRVTITD